MSSAIFQVLNPGFGGTLQDRGRFGWRRFGVPASGPMDDHASAWANRLLNNSEDAPVLELLLCGATLAVVGEAWIALTGADAETNVPLWQAIQVKPPQVIQFPRSRSGVWIYVGVEGGFSSARLLGSASVFQRGGLGRTIARNDILERAHETAFQLLPGVANRAVSWSERRNYESPPMLHVWPGPQWDYFKADDREQFLGQEWIVTSQSDRTGYRLSGIPLRPQPAEIISEPVRVGSIQVPENGQPIVTMRDGPTVGGYPKLGVVDPADLAWLTQCRPGQKIRFCSSQ